MKTLPKTFLIICVASFVAGMSGPGGDFAYGILHPVAALAFILFMMTYIVSSVEAEFDAEENARLGAATAKSQSQPASREYYGKVTAHAAR